MEYRRLGASGLTGPGAQLRRRHVRRPGAAVRRLGHHRCDARRGAWSTSAWRPGSRCSTPPTSTPTAPRRRCSAQAIKGRRDQVLISTKTSLPTGDGPDDAGSSRLAADQRVRGRAAPPRHRPHRPVPAARLRRRHAGRGGAVHPGRCSCGPARSATSACRTSRLAAHEVPRRRRPRTATPRYVAHQVYYSLVGRDYEWELMPLAARPGRRRGRLEPARLGTAHRQDPPRPAAAARQPAAPDRRLRPAGRGRAPLPRHRRPGRASPRRPASRPADRHQLAAAAADRVLRHHRRTQRGTAPAEPRRGRLVAHAGAGRPARRRRAPAPRPTRTSLTSARRASPASTRPPEPASGTHQAIAPTP